ncbi:MAG: asparagine--tRNA ligase [Planctomycetota bacterium]|jgi:asparaginyl-tRNA synthetase
MPTIKHLLQDTAEDQTVVLRGWLRSARHSKNCSFLAVSDGSCFDTLQVVANPDLNNYEEVIRHLGTGCAVEVTGALCPSPGGEQAHEVQAQSITLVGGVEPDYPLQKKRHSFEFLRTQAHLRPRTNTFGAILRVRNTVAAAIHRFFQERDFLWLHSPIITASDCEGAGEMFRVSMLDADKPPRTENGTVDFSQDFFGREAHLTVSGQLEGEIAALALSNIYTFGPTFRAENSNTSRHLAEFWMVEPEMAFCDIHGDMDLAEDFLKAIIAAVLKERTDDMAFFNDRIAKGILSTLESIVQSRFERITYTEAIAILEATERNFEFPVSWGIDLQSEHERFLTEEHFGAPVIVTDYPKEIKAFYMYQNDDGKTVRAMDVLVPKVGEIIGGSQREDRLDRLTERIGEMGLNADDYWWYLDLRRYGSVPHAGFGLGFERIIQFITGMQNIRDVIPFPRVPGYAEF